MTRKQKRALVSILVAFCLTVAIYVTFLFVNVNKWIALAVYILPYAVVGYKVLYDALRGIVRGQVFDEKFLMSVATIGAFALGEYPEAVAVMLFYQVGELFQSIAVGKSRRSITSLMKLRPDDGVVLVDSQEIVTPLEEVEVGQIMLVRVGEAIPLDGVIVEGRSSLDTSALTGESMPKDVETGDVVIGGCMNLSGVLKIEITAPYGESTLSKILEMVENTSSKKAKTENFITKFAKYYTPAVVIGAILVAVIPSLIKGAGEWSVWQGQIRRALIFLVVSCPCALVISVPLTFFGGIGGASKRGILVKGAGYLEKLAKTKTIVFDKTGTLTKGVFGISEVFAIDGDNDRLLKTVALAESFSLHPIAACFKEISAALDKSSVMAEEEAGYGIIAKIDGREVLAGNAKLLIKNEIEFEKVSSAGTIVYVAEERRYLGYVVISDMLKEGAKELGEELKSVGVTKTAMLTGDSREAAAKISEELKIDEFYAELLPDGKIVEFERIAEKAEKGSNVAFVGDGINDAPVLTRADLGIAMGGLGSDVAIEAADVVLMKDDPRDVATGIKISKKTMRIVYENILFALAVKFAVLILGAFGIANMILAIFADVGVCVLAILNAARALKTKRS